MNRMLENRYQILQELGDGGFGKTFIAEDTHIPSRRRCVIKQLKPMNESSQVYQLVKQRFQREAAVLEALGNNSQQIPTLYAYFESGGQFYLVQEYIEGDTLARRLQTQGVEGESTVSKILVNILQILNYVHSQGIVHRDIKPENIILRRLDDLPVLIDFGAVKETMQTTVSQGGNTVKSSIVIGTPGFMPAEQTAGRPVFASDLYALALTAIYLMTGKIPQDLTTDPYTGELAWQEFAPGVSPGFAAVINKAIQSHPRERYRTAKEMLDALPSSNPAYHPAIPINNTITPPTRVSQPPATTTLSSSPWTKTFIPVSIAILLLGGGGAIGYYMLEQQQQFQAELARLEEEQKQRDEELKQAEADKKKGEEEAEIARQQAAAAERKRREAERKRREAERKRREAERKRREAENKQRTVVVQQPPSSGLSYRSSCGSLKRSDTTWYAVVGPKNSHNTIKKRYCGDAFVRKDGYSQVASFSNINQAQNFANVLSAETGLQFSVTERKRSVSSSLSYRSSCGSLKRSGSTWYAVVGPKNSRNTIKERYCGDAFLRKDGNTQVASFSNIDEAQNFAKVLSAETGWQFSVTERKR